MTSPKRYLPIIGIILLLFIILSLDLEAITKQVFSANPILLALAVLTTGITIIGKGAKWRELLFEKKNMVSLKESIEVFLKGFALSLVTPGRIGDFSRALFLKKKVGLVFGLASVILDRLIDIAMLLVLSLLALLAFFQLFGIWVIDPYFITAVLAIFLLVSAYLLRTQKKGFFRNIVFLIVPEKHRGKITKAYLEILSNIKNSRKYPKAVSRSALFGLINWGFSSLTGLLIGTSLGINQPAYFFALVIFILSLIDIIPISIAGIGTREAGTIIMFSAVGLSAEIAVTFSLLYFAVGYILIGIAGGIMLIKKPVPTEDQNPVF